MPELLPGGAERDGVDDRAVAGAQPRAHMGLPDLVGIDEGVGGERDHRLRIAGAEGTRARDRRHDVAVGGGGGDRSVDQQRILAPRRLDRAGERIFEIGAEGAQRDPSRSVTPAAMAWPPPLRRRPVGHRLAHRAAEIDARDRAAGAGADAARLERDGEGRPSEPLLEARGDEADHAGMPAFGGGDDDGALLLDAERGHGLGLGLRHGGELDRLALAVEAVELGGEARAFGRIVLHEQIDAERGATDAAAGIDARPEQEAEMPGLGRAAEPRDIHQGGEPGIVAPTQRQQPLGDEGAVEALERHHVGNRAERDQVEQAEEIGLAAAPASRIRARAARG